MEVTRACNVTILAAASCSRLHWGWRANATAINSTSMQCSAMGCEIMPLSFQPCQRGTQRGISFDLPMGCHGGGSHDNRRAVDMRRTTGSSASRPRRMALTQARIDCATAGSSSRARTAMSSSRRRAAVCSWCSAAATKIRSSSACSAAVRTSKATPSPDLRRSAAWAGGSATAGASGRGTTAGCPCAGIRRLAPARGASRGSASAVCRPASAA